MVASLAAAGVVLGMTALAVPAMAGGRSDQNSSSVNRALSAFTDPSLDAKPMARMWFPDAGAGASAEGLALVEKQIRDIHAGGFGGVEIAYLADDSDVNNDELATVGYGSENWQRILKTMLRTANSLPGGFKIDITITSHWPPIVNTIDPNDDTQQQQATVAYRKVTAADAAAGAAALPLPVQRTEDYQQGFGGNEDAPFLFVDKFTAATLATVTAVSADGTPTFGLASLTDLTGATAADTVSADDAAAGTPALEEGGVLYAGYAAGIPDRAYADANGIDYDSEVLAVFGPEPSDPDLEGKIDADGNRKRMADWQYTYSTDLSGVDLSGYVPSEGDGYEVGDLVLIGSYHQGTGQVMSGGSSVTQYNRTYATDYFSADGVQQVFDFWDANILDNELISLLKKNGKQGTSIFEDSIEVHRTGAIWTADLLDEASAFNGYDMTAVAPVLTLGSAGMFDESAEATRIIEDYNLTLGHLYKVEHADLIKDWAASFGYTYRAQAYPLPGLDVGAAAATVDIPEGDNSGSGDMLRTLKAATNLGREKLLSMETTTFSATIFSTWETVAKVVNSDVSDGVNRAIFHGTAFARTFNGYEASWPGWNFFRNNGGGFSNYNARQIWWDDVDTFSGYVARTQSVMQTGQAKVDVAVLIGSDAGYSISSGNSLQSLLDAGYSYNVLSQALLEEPTAVVTDGVLDPEGSQYQALVVKDAAKLSLATVETLIGYADAGLPIVVMGDGPTRVYGTNKVDDNDADMLAAWASLTAKPGVVTVADEAAVLDQLGADGVTSAASYDVPFLETSHRTDGSTSFYYLFNAGTTLSAAAEAGATTVRVGSVYGLSAGDHLLIGSGGTQEEVEILSISGTTVTLTAPLQFAHAGPSGGFLGGISGDAVSALVDQDVTLTGEGTPYVLNAWTGEVEPLAVYSRDGDTITFTPRIGGEDAEIVALVKDNGKLPSATDVSGGELVVASNKLELHAFEVGDYEVTLADGSVKQVEVSSVPADVELTDGWDLSLESWGPDAEANAVDPTISAKTTVEFSDVSLGDWAELPASEEQLADLGVASMGDVSGTGTYSTTFRLGRDWRDAGAVLDLAHGSGDMVVQVVVNGTVIDDVDQLTDAVDLSKGLKVGTNTVTVTIDTSLNHRYVVENTGASRSQTYGLTGVALDAYTIATVPERDGGGQHRATPPHQRDRHTCRPI
ncbi:glycosyl hydrolase [Actinotalea sp. M2MS4P-6]|uniref:glycosyl hydrolase n=1 Tax=Actinotalea sp. M2MS4P-6 TaxID=2983762 RepID=UPI0021E4C4A0|nr:glycosyl hydrolase [Actinotalea sp. M2MS4P-6]MCV2395889.1 glycosyl hydrolase [Actinotalea sp. M2MS4P-6]